MTKTMGCIPGLRNGRCCRAGGNSVRDFGGSESTFGQSASRLAIVQSGVFVAGNRGLVESIRTKRWRPGSPGSQGDGTNAGSVFERWTTVGCQEMKNETDNLNSDSERPTIDDIVSRQIDLDAQNVSLDRLRERVLASLHADESFLETRPLPTDASSPHVPMYRRWWSRSAAW